MVSMQTKKKLQEIKKNIEKIVNKPVSEEDIIKILISVKPLEEAIWDLMLQ